MRPDTRHVLCADLATCYDPRAGRQEIARAEELSTTRAREKAEAEARRLRDEGRGTEKSIFHGTSLFDYQGRSYLHIPGDVETNLHGEAGSQNCFLPKACVHTFTGHTKGVSALRLFPKSGHLMLSASMDTKIKVSTARARWQNSVS